MPDQSLVPSVRSIKSMAVIICTVDIEELMEDNSHASCLQSCTGQLEDLGMGTVQGI